ncbi:MULTISPECIES: hypothetical protein [Asticcacaulis]|uniref:hypothetical protein n=1 Tax=Asticcacaulis TaxID=76890 RepID=UPI001AE4CBAF|nr:MULTISPECIES: hypothetical protein [Asticcacaulis]MBP2159578.1 hypothetical protein [Asticcacaulis solisilvae]MDR6800595.1 hypothetical protein [Asticcacaulis sp. BE141]
MANLTLITTTTPPATSWRSYVANVRADAIEPGSTEVAQFMADNPGEFASEAEAIEAYRADHAFLCPVLGHWFRFEDGKETADGWVHVDAPTIGYNDPDFDYGNSDAETVHKIYEAGFLMAAE